MKARLEAYYTLIAPDTLTDAADWRKKFDQIYQKYGGSHEGERKLAKKLAKKYGVAVRLMVAADPSAADSATKDQQKFRQSGEKRQESWYMLRQDERGSGNLSFTAVGFDPEATLAAREGAIVSRNSWIENSPRLDTVAQFALHLPSNDPQRKEPFNSRKRPAEVATAVQAEKKTRQSHPFDDIAASNDTGPLARLQTFRRQRVRLVIRYVNAIRGILTGTLVAFDKHMNMILRDVEEEYSQRPTDRGLVSNVEQESKRRQDIDEGVGEGSLNRDEGNLKRRKMKQLLVRGDNVVMVSIASEAKSVQKSRYIKR